jgi:hypothetical protein
MFLLLNGHKLLWCGITKVNHLLYHQVFEEVVHMALKSLYANESVSFTSFIRSFSAFLAKVGWAIERSGDPAEVFKKYALKYS